MLTRQKELLQWLLGGVSTAVVIVGTIYATDHRTELVAAITGQEATLPSQSPEPTDKEKVLKSVAVESQDGKGGGSMNVSITSPNKGATAEPLILKAQVSALEALNDVRFEWILPEGVSISKGNASGSIGNIADGASGEIEISLNVPAGDNKQIHLQVYRLIDGEHMGQVAQYNSVEIKDSELSLALKRADNTREPASASASASASSEKPKMMQ